ncbi:unnamed protein product [Caenorhabditis bovis]|uniref:Ground-like domain-containing protein n=1 Tax=Caenorhabditis bovis TaxID=2654633 RepID=A0A8S1FBS2_9PELO|nr:unnamed protein product [Caenorhabditis bovis]
MLYKFLVLSALIHITSQFLFPTVTPNNGCCCGGPPPPPPPSCGCGSGCGGRKKREVGHVRGHITHENHDEINNQCNSREFSDVILKNLGRSSLKSTRDAIYKELDQLYPENVFSVVCVASGVASFQADASRYCMEGKGNQTCYVFEF